MAALGVAGVAGTGCADQSAAIRVGDETVSEQDLVSEMDALRDNEEALQAIVGATRADIVGEMGDDSYLQLFAGYLIEQRVFYVLQHQLAVQEGVEPGDAEVEEMRSQLESQLEEAGVDAGDLPDDYLDQLAQDFATGEALQAQIPTEEIQASLVELVERTDVELSSHLGEWNKDAFLAALQGQGERVSAVTPPPAPQPAPGDDSGADLGLPAG